MGRKKQAINQIPADSDFREFSDQERSNLEQAIGHDLSEEFIGRLECEFFLWSSMFKNYKDFEYGKDERDCVKSIKHAARDLLLALDDLGSAKELVLEDLAAAEGVRPVDFQLVLVRLNKLDHFFETKLSAPLDPGASQIAVLMKVFAEFDMRTTVGVNNYVTEYSTSPFVEFVRMLWELRPELRVYTPTGNKANNLSQWIAAKRRVARVWIEEES